MDLLRALTWSAPGDILQNDKSCAGTHLELESELRARLVQWISSCIYSQACQRGSLLRGSASWEAVLAVPLSSDGGRAAPQNAEDKSPRL